MVKNKKEIDRRRSETLETSEEKK